MQHYLNHKSRHLFVEELCSKLLLNSIRVVTLYYCVLHLFSTEWHHTRSCVRIEILYNPRRHSQTQWLTTSIMTNSYFSEKPPNTVDHLVQDLNGSNATNLSLDRTRQDKMVSRRTLVSCRDVFKSLVAFPLKRSIGATNLQGTVDILQSLLHTFGL